ncbi:MAG: hypothetical protein HQL52_04780 [Magnetococcales bacterium]|nr:hypothetical protein [Magnetococcales bacterium]
MDKQQLLDQLSAAIGEARKWAETGWPMTFGRRDNAIPSLRVAEALPKNMVNRSEAVSYWQCMAEVGEETAAQGEKALQAAKDEAWSTAEGALYYAVFMEKRLTKPTETWRPVWEAVKARAEGG